VSVLTCVLLMASQQWLGRSHLKAQQVVFSPECTTVVHVDSTSGGFRAKLDSSGHHVDSTSGHHVDSTRTPPATAATNSSMGASSTKRPRSNDPVAAQPKVALLFLTGDRGIAQEPTWRDFLLQAALLHPPTLQDGLAFSPLPTIQQTLAGRPMHPPLRHFSPETYPAVSPCMGC